MKNRSKLAILILILSFVACKQTQKETNPDTTAIEKNQGNTEEQLYSCPMHPKVTGKKGATCSVCGMELTQPVTKSEASPKEEKTEKVTITPFSSTVDAIVNDYLKLKNALVKDDSKAAATAGKALLTAFNNVNTASIDAKMKKEYLEIADDAKENAEHIGDNSGKIAHQREHFAMLSKDVSDLIKIFGTHQKLYQDYCPMYDQGKSGYWISEIKNIKNPYYGSEMLTCGGIEKEW